MALVVAVLVLSGLMLRAAPLEMVVQGLACSARPMRVGVAVEPTCLPHLELVALAVEATAATPVLHPLQPGAGILAAAAADRGKTQAHRKTVQQAAKASSLFVTRSRRIPWLTLHRSTTTAPSYR